MMRKSATDVGDRVHLSEGLNNYTVKARIGSYTKFKLAESKAKGHINGILK